MLGEILHAYPTPLHETAIRRGLGEDYLRSYEGSFGGQQNFLLYSKMRTIEL